MFVESLEGRTLLSVSPISTQVKIDRLTVKADFLQFRSDIASNNATILADLQILKNDGLKNDPALVAPLKAFRADVKKMHQALFADRLDEKASVLKDQLLIVNDQIQILKDKGDATALTTDRAKILTDRVQLQTDEIAGLDARITTRQTFFTTLSNDITALVTAAESDPNASPQLQLDIQKFATDRSGTLSKLTTDLTTIATARTTLAADLMALEM